MLVPKDHCQILICRGVLDLTFARRGRGWLVANVKSTPRRFYARNAVKTTLDRASRLSAPGPLMQPTPAYHSGIHPALTSFADECCATLARLIAYVGALVLFAIVGLHFFDQWQFDTVAEPADQPGFVLAQRSRPAFAVSSLDIPDKSEVLRDIPASGWWSQGCFPLEPAGAKTGGRARDLPPRRRVRTQPSRGRQISRPAWRWTSPKRARQL